MSVIRITAPAIPEALKSVAGIEEKVMSAGERGLKAGLQIVAGIAQQKYLTGPRPTRLGVVTGRLRGSISVETSHDASHVTGKIGTNIKYGGFHEFGFHGIEHVKQHTRVTGHAPLSRIEEKHLRKNQIRDDQGNVVGQHRTKAALLEKLGIVSQNTTVRAHDRKIDYAGRPFIAPALEEGKGAIVDQVQKEWSKIKP